MGAHGAACTRPAADLCPERLHRHQQRPSAGHAPLAQAVAPPLPAARAVANPTASTSTNAAASPLTTVTLPSGIVPSPVAAPPLSICQCLDETALAPRLVRVRAKVLRALPTDPLLWTVLDPAADGISGCGAIGSNDTATMRRAPWRYQLVLQLADEHLAGVTLGAALLGAEGEAFFPGLPAADLSASNATLAALRARMGALCDGRVAEFALWACRPDERERSAWGVAYHVVATQCLVH